ncbi:MAG: hydantoinase B/oxoprolinase family protein [Actinomycetota bacterium]|jgi:N-methylhydantoinase B|nr:hydantoinase B/oxoprolinase family protein [Actinomycetota bacterium]
MTTTLASPAPAARGALTRAVDPITTEIIRSGLNAAADEMNATLIRSAYTPVIYEMKDCSVGLLDDRHQILGQSAGLPIFLGNLEVVTELTEVQIGREGWHPDDVWILNDSYLAGTHLHDMTVYGPVFVDAELVGFATCRAHWLDVGSKDAGGSTDSTDIFQEGLRLGPTKVVDGGKLLDDVVDVLTRNGRFPYPARGDLFAQVACVRTGQDRLARLVRRYGIETIRAAREQIFEQTERLERAAVQAIPDGIYEAEGCLDDDGVVPGVPRWVRVRVEVVGDRMVLDLSGTDDMAEGPVNCGAAQAVSAARVAYKLLVNPDKPVDGGAFRPLEVKVRPGSLLAAEEPAPCEWYFTPLGLLIDLVVKALAPVMPDRCAAASYGDSMVIGIAGKDPRNGLPYLVYEPTVGGWGAWRGGDGQDALINNVNGSLKDVPIEVAETKYPVYLRRYAIRQDSGGPGTWRGGNGVEREYVLEADGVMSLWFERSKTPAWGLFGGQDATPPEVVVNEGRPGETKMLKVNAFRLKKGDTVVCRTGGGGGFGDPAERSRVLVEADLRDGRISMEMARRVYGYVEN